MNWLERDETSTNPIQFECVFPFSRIASHSNYSQCVIQTKHFIDTLDLCECMCVYIYVYVCVCVSVSVSVLLLVCRGIFGFAESIRSKQTLKQTFHSGMVSTKTNVDIVEQTE